MASIRSLVLAGALALLPTLAWTAAPAPQSLADEAERLLRERAQPQADTLGAEIEVRIPTLLSRAGDAPCPAEVFLPSTSRPWGKTHVGLRCADSNWTIRVPAEVALNAVVAVPSRAIRAGDVLSAGDWTMLNMNVAGWRRGVTVDESLLLGAKVTRPLRQGEPISPDALTSSVQVLVGDPVSVTLVGRGFSVKTEGQIVQQASVGESARVKLESGRTVAGILRDSKRVEVRM